MVVLAMITVFGVSVMSHATEGTQISGTGIYWRVEGNELILEYSGAGLSETPEYSNYEDQPWFENINDISIITIGEGITGLGNGNFNSMRYVEIINWPTTLRTIGNNVFGDGCTDVDPIVVPEGVETIGATFFGCYSSAYHSSITFPSTLTSVSHHLLLGVLEGRGTVTFLGNPPNITDGTVLGDDWRTTGGDRKINVVVPYGKTDAYRQILDPDWVIDITELPPRGNTKR